MSLGACMQALRWIIDVFSMWLDRSSFGNWVTYRISWIIRRTYNPLFFSKMERAPNSPVRLMCGSGCALSPNSKQILCRNNLYQHNSTSLNSFFFKSKLLSFLRSNYQLSFSLRVCFFSSPTLVPFTIVSFSSLQVRKHTRASRMYCNMYSTLQLAVDTHAMRTQKLVV